jgi:hypothetical protein
VAWAVGEALKVHIAQDPFHAVYLLTMTPQSGAVIAMFESETKRGEFEEAGEVDRTFRVIITRGRGMKLEPGASLTDGVAGGKPMFELVEALVAVVRALEFDPVTTETHVNYRETKPFTMEGYTLDAYQVEFSIGCQLPAVA